MKMLAFATLLLMVSVPLAADSDSGTDSGNWLTNGDFSDGISHWHGDGRAPSDFAPESPLDKADPFTSKGLIIPLRSADWTKVAQDFRGKSASGVMTVTYMVSPDLTFSTNHDDYVNMPDHIGYDAWAAFNTPPGDWVIFISDFGSYHGTYYEVKSKLGSSEVQIFKAHVKGLTPEEDKTMTIAFPPGSGKVVILSVVMSDK